MKGQLDGKVAIVTGAAQGIGNAIAKGLAAEGARIVVADLNRAEEVAQVFEGGIGLTVDVAEEAQVERMAQQVFERCKGIDSLLKNAGRYTCIKILPFPEIQIEAWRT